MKKLLCKFPFLKNILTKSPQVHVLRLSGILTSSNKRNPSGELNLNTYKDIIDEAFTYPGADAIFLEINCPGGSPVQSELLANYIRKQSEKHEIPVYSFIEEVGASGGYWLACAGEKIYALKSSIVGSIGVVSASFGFQKLIEHYGIERRIHTSGTQKSFLDPFEEEKKTDIARLKKLQQTIHNDFISWVKLRRKDTLKATDKELFEGQFWLGEEAVNNGIIDEINSILDVAESTYGEKVKIKYFQTEKGFLSSIFSLKISPDIHALEQASLWQRFRG